MVLLLIETIVNPFESIGATDGFTVDCVIVCCKNGFIDFGVVKFGWRGEIRC